ncbi:MAG: DUF1343 domain-containing protein [Verrucomicrobia bacterium]|nr:DUF1343 domain-containing protein [Verrucomicrobiota bacterium]
MKYLLLFLLYSSLWAKVELGVDRFFQTEVHELRGMRVGLITNQTGVTSTLHSTIDLLKASAKEFKFVALFAPEHGLEGIAYAGEDVEDATHPIGVRVYSLHGKTRRPTSSMLDGIDVLIYDIQEIGSRSYTYASTLFYVMEEAAKKGIQVVVLDRPNPINGLVVDGPMLEEQCRSFLGYINVPYCHGMTIGELALFFNSEYRIGCNLKVTPMAGWKRSMTFRETGLPWIPTSPQIPESDTALFYPATGLLGCLDLVSIGGGCSLPFKVVAAPWIDAKKLAKELAAQKLSGVSFVPFHFRPLWGEYKGQTCHGVKMLVTHHTTFRPVSVDFMIFGVLKSLYPTQVDKKLRALSKSKKEIFTSICGTPQVLDILLKEKYVAWKLIRLHQEERKVFMEKRKKYLLY